MKNNEGSILLILGVIAAIALLGGGAVYYKNNQNKLNSNNENTDISGGIKSLFETASNMSPKELSFARTVLAKRLIILFQ